MKILIAPDSFKETLTATDAANAIEEGFLDIFPEANILKLPIADGGEGTVDVLVTATQGKYFSTKVSGPTGEYINAKWGMLGNSKTAVIEIAEACGLHLVALKKRNPMNTSSFGVGELILAATDEGAEHIIIGLGGSATNDGGMGFLKAIGVQFLDSFGKELTGGVESLNTLSDINITSIDSRLKGVSFEIACDVDNPLIGPQGASVIFGSQKGADEKMINQLDNLLSHYSRIASSKLNNNLSMHPGAGAAGGIGYGFLAFLKADQKSGVQIILEKLNFEQHLLTTDLVITGEGRFDSQSLRGKAPMGVIDYARKHKCSIFVIAGSTENDEILENKYDIDKLFSIISNDLSFEQSIVNPHDSLMATARKAAQHYKKYYLNL
ncbi:MAG: glycerate kinase [Gammaproteobacteria bacterium]|jgi:glycerate kinase|nr:glycerate kinase [Gammaproteobacteria bacterium]